ncbi:MAG: hypothetical protein ACFNVX_00465 [Lachnoanaerobaculum saburreum]
MKKRNLKNKVAVLLSASMTLAMLAPAMPVYAANSKLIFDFATKNPAVGNIVSNVEYSGSSGGTFKAVLTAANSNWRNSSDLVGLPYWGSTDLGDSANDFDPTKNVTNNNSSPWDVGMDLKGYKIKEWRNGKDNSTKVDRVEQPYFQNTDTAYYATLTDDGNNVASYWVTRRGKAGVYVPGVVDDPATPFKAGASISAKADVPTGYKLLNQSKADNGDGGKTIDIFDSQTPTPAANAQPPSGTAYAHANNVALDYSASQRSTINQAHNRDVVVNYRYDVDTDTKFSVNVWDVFFDGNGNEISRSKRTTLTKSVLDDLGTVGGFDATKINPSGSTPARYIKKGAGNVKYFYEGAAPDYTTPVSVVFSKKQKSGGSDGDFEAENMVDANMDLPNSAGKTFNINGNDEIVGKMINQKVDVYYNYQLNPAYFTNITVQYVDENGTNITGKVIAATKDSSYPGSAPRILDAYDASQAAMPYANGNELMVKVDSTLGINHVKIPVPKLKGYKFTAGDLSIESLDPGKWNANYSPQPPVITMQSGYAESEVWQTSSAADSVVLRVIYNMDAAELVKIIPQVGMGGELKVANASGVLEDYEPSVNASHQKYVNKEAGSSASTNKVTITAEDLPQPVPNSGYLFDKWVYVDGNTEFTQSDLPKDFEIPASSNASMKFKAVFVKDPTRYNTYHLESGDGYTQLIGDPNPSLLNVDSSGNPVDVHFSDLSANTDVGVGLILTSHPFGTNYNVVWYDSNNNVVYKVDSSNSVLEQDTRAIVNGETFRVYVESNAPAVAYNPQLENGAGGTPELLNSVTGEPQIVIDSANPSPLSSAIDYVVTDENGNVVQVIPGTDLLQNGGVIANNSSSSFLTPGNKYKVYTALRGSGATVGSPIPSTNVSSTPLDVTIPVAPTPLVTADDTNQGRAMIRITPTADNTEYALVDNDGNEVYPFTTPTSTGNGDNGTIEFRNLDPDTIYHVVPRAKGSGTSVADRMAAGAQLPVDTSNMGLGVSEFKVEVTTAHPGTDLISALKVDGETKQRSDFDAALSNIKKGKTVEIVAPLIDGLSNDYYTWRIVSPSGLNVSQGTGGTASSPANTRIVFTMPNGPVKLQIMYNDGVIWDPDNWTGDNASNKNIGVTIPNISVPAGSQMRITVKKDSVPANIKQTIADTLTEKYTAEYMFRIVVEQKDASGNWVEYTDPAGDISLDDVRINTGALDFSKNYMLHELATSSNAATLVKDNIGRNSSTSADPTYPGEFGQNMQAGKVYVFGYSKPLTYKVKVVDNSNNKLVASFDVPENHTVNDFASKYKNYVKTDNPDKNGITWKYVGLSSDKDSFVEYDANTRVTQDMTIYMFYSNDKDDRKKADDDLKAGIQNAKDQLAKITDPVKKAALQAAIDAAMAVLNKSNPRKATTAELKAALDALNQAVRDAGGTAYIPKDNDNKGGGGRHRGGGGSSGGGTGSAKGKSTGLRVGQDGNWELLNPAEATANPDNSKWVFNLASGGKVKGWAYLSYTYQGQTKSEWYHFGDDNTMNTGWLVDGGKWYYLSMDHNGFYGEMVKGWHFETQDNRWYYLNPSNGSMHTDWLKDGNEFYYLNPVATEQTWFYDSNTERWNYGDRGARSLGSMFQNENTPDGYHVNENGAWR